MSLSPAESGELRGAIALICLLLALLLCSRLAARLQNVATK
jgi:hypothetical protein